jgi:hypothetical protein
MTKKISEYKVSLPEYSLAYLINNDTSSLDSDDKIIIDDAMLDFYDEVDKNGGSVVISVDNEESHFTWLPFFGLPCNCVDATILILA